jgi:adenosylmethionine-8-amino-7-oxononanoate aminotransferase
MASLDLQSPHGTPVAGTDTSVSAEVLDAAARHLWRPWAPAALPPQDSPLLVSGDGCFVVDQFGSRLIDARAGSLSASCGYGCQPIIDAVVEQASGIMSADLGAVLTAPAPLLAKKLSELLPRPLDRTFFVGSGSEATETAVKMARMYHALRGAPGRRTILTFRDGYHGTTLAALSASPSVVSQQGNEPLPQGFVSVDTPRCAGCDTAISHANCRMAAAVDAVVAEIERLGETLAGVLLEPVLGVGGVLVLPDDLLVRVRRACEEVGALLVVDEVLTGFGRTGSMFGFEHSGVVPDIVLMSKGLSSGYVPIGAVSATTAIYETFRADPLLGGFRHGHTNSGHPVACAAALAAIKFIEDGKLVERAARVGSLMLAELRARLARHPNVRAVRGRGLLIGIEIDEGDRPGAIARAALEFGLLVRQQDNVITLCPPLVITEGIALEAVTIFERAIEAVGTAT